MKVKCIDDSTLFITKGKVYKVIEIEKYFYWIYNDEGEYHFYKKELFKTIEMKTEVTEESLRKAYNEGCEDVKEVLRNLYPDFEFEDKKYFNLFKLEAYNGYSVLFTASSSKDAGFNSNGFFQIRESGEFADKSFFLDDSYNWEIKRDDKLQLCLIPTKKHKR